MISNKQLAEFKKYIRIVMDNTVKDYYKNQNKFENEISVEDVEETFLSCANMNEDVSFNLGKNYEYLENIFSRPKHYNAMKKLSNREKLVIGLIVFENKLEKEVAKVVNTTEDNVSTIKRRAFKKFKKNMEE